MNLTLQNMHALITSCSRGIVRQEVIRDLILFILLAMMMAGVLRADEGPAQVVKACYDAHFSGDMAFTADSVARKQAWLTPALYDLLQKELRKPASPDEAPAINGDPFTDTQEYPISFTIGEVDEKGGIANIKVNFVLPGGGKRTVRAVLNRSAESWRIDDLLYEDGTSLRKLLSGSP